LIAENADWKSSPYIITGIPPEIGLVEGLTLLKTDPTSKILNSALVTAHEKPSMDTSIETATLLKTGSMQEIVVELNGTAGCSMY
jgi:hypothetical protein